MRHSHNACILSYRDVDGFFSATGMAIGDAPESPATRAIFRACRLEELSADAVAGLKAEMQATGVETLILPRASDDGAHTFDAVLLGTLDRYEAGLDALLTGESPGLADVGAQVQEALTLYDSQRGQTRCGTMELRWGARTYVMGIINVTPDSFSGDGVTDPRVALAQAQEFVEAGVDIVDVGGASSRPAFTYPGAKPVDAQTELDRVLPAIRLLAKEIQVPISIDTCRASVARAALEEGARMVNDVWGLMADLDMAGVIAEYGVPVVLMHNKHQTQYLNLMSEIIRQLRQSIDIALGAGIKNENIVVDPGIGFGKTKEHNIEVLSRLDELKVLGRPILLGVSRKAFIGHLLNLPPDRRVEGTAAAVALGIARGADIVRVHDVREMVKVARVSDAIVRKAWQRSI